MWPYFEIVFPVFWTLQDAPIFLKAFFPGKAFKKMDASSEDPRRLDLTIIFAGNV